jgi:DNA-binding GntR family transcriptional regulator
MIVEGLAAKWAAINATEKEIADIEEVLGLEQFYTERRDYPHILMLDTKFHQLVFTACKSKPLMHVLSTFHEYIRQARNTSLMSPGRALKAYDEHKAIFNAIKSRDSELASKIMTEHIMKAKESLARESKK